MCLAVPARVVSIDADQMGTVEIGGVGRQVALDLVPETEVGDYVIVHVGFAIERLDEAEAEETLALLNEFLPGE
jgi:hydrogenase expression/formation protein HypC